MWKNTTHANCSKWNKKKKPTTKKKGENKNSVKDVMSGMYSNFKSYLSGWASGCSSEPFQVT